MPDPQIHPYVPGEPPDRHGDHLYETRERRQRSGWHALGVAVLVLFALCGLTVIGGMIFVMIGMRSMGGNK